MASTRTKFEWNYARNVFGLIENWGFCWIGARNDLDGNADITIWSWIDGSKISNSYGFNPDASATTGQGPWQQGEPSDLGNEHCIHLTLNDL